MKRDIRKLIAEYNRKYSNNPATIREHLYTDDMQQIMEIAKEKMLGRDYHSIHDLLFYAIDAAWMAGVVAGAKRKKS